LEQAVLGRAGLHFEAFSVETDVKSVTVRSRNAAETARIYFVIVVFGLITGSISEVKLLFF